MIDVSWYTKNFDLFNLSKHDYDSIFLKLHNDFYYKTRNLHHYSQFERSINELLYILNYLHDLSNWKFDVVGVWKSLYNSVISQAFHDNFLIRDSDLRNNGSLIKRFRDLENIFQKKFDFINANLRKKKQEEVKRKNEENAFVNLLKFMELSENFNESELTRKYRLLSLKYHPDKGGSQEMFLKLQEVRDKLKEYLATKK